VSRRRPRGVIVAAARSGAGKTTLTLGLLRALRNQGVAVQPFKCGPDYIDPAFHTAAAGRQSVNLDTWAMRPQLIDALIASHASDADFCVVEGVMGLFDGAPARGQSARGSTADLAALTGWPIVLVLDVATQAETAAAIVLGCKMYRDDLTIGGVILNMSSSARHEMAIAPAIEALGIGVLGAIRRSQTLALPDRHLGLVQAVETTDLDSYLERAAANVAAVVDLARLSALARPLRQPDVAASAAGNGMRPPGQRIAVAQDAAFSFLYPHLLESWRRAGATISTFSPLADEAPATDSDAVWLPGGYPELHAGALASAERFKHGMRALASRDIPLHGECGGYMVLGAGLETADGQRHEMLGLLGLETSFRQRRLHLGYRRARLLPNSTAALAASELWGHEFHYSTVLANPDLPLADIVDAMGDIVADRGSRRGSVTGTFFHLIDAT
jgi:cobyrinic acid a,c-diamide synthase